MSKGIHPAIFNENPETRQSLCKHHGEFTSRRLFTNLWSSCPTCSSIKKTEIDKKERAIKQRQTMEQRSRRVGASGIPKIYRHKSFDDFKVQSKAQQKALTAVMEYTRTFALDAKKNGSSMMLLGNTGTGKTHLASTMATELIKRHGQRCYYTTIMRYLRRIKDSWRSDGESESAVIDAAVQPDLLILDEVGIQQNSEFEQNLLFDVLNQRYERGKPVVLVSNLDTQGVTEVLGVRLMRRLKEVGTTVVPFSWPTPNA